MRSIWGDSPKGSGLSPVARRIAACTCAKKGQRPLASARRHAGRGAAGRRTGGAGRSAAWPPGRRRRRTRLVRRFRLRRDAQQLQRAARRPAGSASFARRRALGPHRPRRPARWKPSPSSRSSHVRLPSAHRHRRVGGRRTRHQAARERFGVWRRSSRKKCKGGRNRQASAVHQGPRERMPLLTSCSTASRNRRLMSLFGVMKSVARVELRMFSSAAYSRSSA